MPKRIIFTITNDPDFDQRMQRICSSLQDAGYEVLLAGRKMRPSTKIARNYQQRKMRCLFHRGPLQYLEYHGRLFWWLLFRKADIVCAIDIDTILPVYLVCKIRGIKRIFDAHEYFSELKEVVTRPVVQFWWRKLEDYFIPRFPDGYTVGAEIARVFKENYGVSYAVIRNVPARLGPVMERDKRLQAIIYQGAINEARGLEWLIPAMHSVDAELHLYGSGNFETAIKALVNKQGLQHKIKFFGMVPPAELAAVTGKYLIGINLVEPTGLNQYYSLANKFFDYIQAGVPQVTMNFPEYSKINQEKPVGILLDGLDSNGIAQALNILLNDRVIYQQLVENCNELKERFCWEQEKNSLLKVYEKL